MGLCKCPKKKVTNLFCFEHKVNVCEHCLVESHDKCIVKSYLQWLEDSDYNPICAICKENLQTEDVECVRLVCYDVFHLHCLDLVASKLPETTAPAGYECPSCSHPLIPHSQQGGPLAHVIRTKLGASQWFQRALHGTVTTTAVTDTAVARADEADTDTFELVEPSPPPPPPVEATLPHLTRTHDHSVYQMLPDSEPSSANIRKSAAGHKPPHQDQHKAPSGGGISMRRSPNEDEENKYTRRPLLTHLATLIRAHFPYSTARRSPQKAYYHFMLTLVLGLVVFVLLLWFFSVLGRYSAENDPLLDPRSNPDLIMPRRYDREVVDNAMRAPDGADKQDDSIVRGGNNLQPPALRPM